MDLRLPKTPIRSIRDLVGHIIAVTAGVLVALLLQQAADHYRHRQLAAQAESSIRREIMENRGQVEEELANMIKLRAQIAGQIANLQKTHPDPYQIPGIALNLTSSTSWETAIATQAVNYLPYDEVHRHAEAYAVFRLFDQQEQAGLRDWQQLGSFGDDLVSLTAEQRVQLLEALHRYDKFTDLVDLSGQAALKSSEFVVPTH